MTGLTGADRSFFYGAGPPPQNEAQINLDFQAGTLIYQAGIGRSRPEDTIDTHILNGMPYGWNRSDPGKPTLEFPFILFRALKEDFPKDDGRLSDVFEQLKNRLPADMKNRLNEQMALPPGERSPVYSSLNLTLNLTALMLLWLGQAADPASINNTTLRIALQNLELSSRAMQQLIAQLEIFLQKGLALMRQIGANHPHFDQMLKFLAEAKEALKLIRQISDEERRHKKKKPQGKEEENEEDLRRRRKQIKSAVDQLERIHKNYQNTAGSSEMQIFGTMVNGLAIIAKSHTLSGGMRSLFMGLMITQTENEKGANGALPLEKSMQHFLQTLTRLLFKKYHAEENSGLETFFSFFITFALVIILTTTLYFLDPDAEAVVSNEANDRPKKFKVSNEAQLATRTYFLMNLIEMVLEMDLLSHFFRSPKKSDVLLNPSDRYQLQHALEFITLGLVLKIISCHDKELGLILLLGLAPCLETRIKSLEDSLYSVNVREEEYVSKSNIEKAVLHLTACRLSLTKNELSHYYEAYDAFVSAFCPNMEAFNKDIDMFYELAREMRICFTKDIKDFSNSLTGVVQI